MNFCLLTDDEDIVLNASWVAPGSVNDHPPTDIHVSSPVYLVFSAVKRPNRDAEFESIGAIWKLLGSKKAKAKLMCVKPERLSSSGVT